MSFTEFPIPSVELQSIAQNARTAINALENTNTAVNAKISDNPALTVAALSPATSNGGLNGANKLALYEDNGRLGSVDFSLWNDSGTIATLEYGTGASDGLFTFLNGGSGVVATDNTAVMLTGTQTINGSKTFTGQTRITGQALTAVSSVVTRETGDARYGTYSDILNADLPVISSTTLVPVVSITLPIGLYQLDAFISSQHNSAGGCKILFGTTSAIKVGLNDSYSRPLVASVIYPLSFSTYNNGNTNSTRSDVGANEYRRSLSGVVEILTAGTTISLQYAQSVSNALASNAKARSHIIARKIN